MFIGRDGGLSCQCRGYYGSEELLYGLGFLAVVKKLVTMGSDLDFLSCLFMSCNRSLSSLVAVLSSFSCGSLGRTKYCVSWKLNSFSFSGVAAQSLFDPSRLISLIAVVDWWSWSSLYILVGGVIFGRYVDMV